MKKGIWQKEFTFNYLKESISPPDQSTIDRDWQKKYEDYHFANHTDVRGLNDLKDVELYLDELERHLSLKRWGLSWNPLPSWEEFISGEVQDESLWDEIVQYKKECIRYELLLELKDKFEKEKWT